MKWGQVWTSATLAAIALVCMRPAAAQIGVVTVTGGRVEGVTADGVTSFKGIPFAAPPVGNLRWRAPQAVVPWHGIRKADHFAAGCTQAPHFIAAFGEPPAMSEDCLYLNVWAPAKSAQARLPVMVWIYGGSFLGGMTSEPVYDGTHLARKGVVVVSIAYRLGVFGFLADPALSAESPHHVSGNYGLLDMIAGLRWVKHNIARFGGDPSRVTIFGQSAGGMAVSLLAQSPLAKGLFRRAVAESGAGFLPPVRADLEAAEASGERFLAKLGAKNIEAARALSAQALLTATGRAFKPTTGISGFARIVVSDYAFPIDGQKLYRTRRFNDTSVLLGSTSLESLSVPASTSPSQFEARIRAQFGSFGGKVLAVYPHATVRESTQAMADLWRDMIMVWPDWTWARLQSEYGKGKVYLYYFDAHAPQYPPHGAPHGAEIGYVFDNLGALIHTGAKMTFPAAATDPALAAIISGYWVNFAKTGNPNGPGRPYWPAFTASSQRVMYLDTHPHVGPVPNVRQLKALDAYFAWARQQERSPAPTQH